jgi:dCTP diphosphatase
MSEPGKDPFTSLLAELHRFVDEREWAQFHDPKNLAMCQASEARALLAEYRWVRNEDSDAISHEAERRARIAAEIGDVGIALLLLCDRIGLDFLESISAKLAKNARRYPVESSRGHAEPPARRGL